MIRTKSLNSTGTQRVLMINQLPGNGRSLIDVVIEFKPIINGAADQRIHTFDIKYIDKANTSKNVNTKKHLHAVGGKKHKK